MGAMALTKRVGHEFSLFEAQQKMHEIMACQCQAPVEKSLVAVAQWVEALHADHRKLAGRHRSLFFNHPDGICGLDLAGRFERGNEAFEAITGFACQEMLGHHFCEFIEASYRHKVQAAFEKAASGSTCQYEALGVRRDGRVICLEIVNFPIELDGEIAGVYAACRDVTESKRREAELRLLQRGVEATPNGIMIADALLPDTPLVYANESFYQTTGYTPDEVLGRNCRYLHGEETDPQALDALRSALQRHTEIEVTLLNYRKDKSTFWNHLSISPILDEHERCTHFIGIQQDITKYREQEERLAFQATHDPLTGLPNSLVFEERLEASFRQCQGLLVVMQLDLDGFKAVNDGLGHHVGNKLLREVARRFQCQVEPGDTLARLVGDEFGLLLPGLGCRDEGASMAQRLLDALANPIEIEGQPLHISASIGLACNCEPTVNAQELMQRADLAMSSAKQKGRNTWEWYNGEGQRDVTEFVLLRHDLHAAIQSEQFELHYQPIVDAVSGTVRSVEALVRWPHPKRGQLSPGIFIPLAEQTGQIIDLGRWVLRQACQDAADLLENDGWVLPVAVNISSLQFRREGFLQEVCDILAETGLPAELLELEVTESVLMQGAKQAISLIASLRKLGVRVALDDFGTGFSSLSYLRDLPINKVKLDRSFIRDMVFDRNCAAIVQGIITMAHHMGLVVVAEGVEEIEQQQDLVRRHCDYLQGFHFSRPVPLHELKRLPDRLPYGAEEVHERLLTGV
ncbi:EAL domain-containing protein [Halomonas sp. MCCC 1A11058]|uniref:EAL domain-containing protein n=2 Tax=Billgrantia aerodenitrificans TaxID=2733483 RepID=A0ABS9AYN1_9GAMM|nr:EAL domain-containing protein [Halomonas aerodenitrificans]